MINVYTDSDTEETFDVTKGGVPFDLDAESVTKVEVYVCCGTANLVDEDERVISSATGDITWVTSVLRLKLGHLGLQPGKYVGKVKFFDASTPLGFVVAELKLKVQC